MSPTKTIDYVKSNFRVVKREKNPLLNYFEVNKLSILINFVGLQNEKSDIPAETNSAATSEPRFVLVTQFHYCCDLSLHLHTCTRWDEITINNN